MYPNSFLPELHYQHAWETTPGAIKDTLAENLPEEKGEEDASATLGRGAYATFSLSRLQRHR